MNFLKYPKKSLGQNFLVDNNIINKIIQIGNIDNYKKILEIGPGYGSLTKKILDNKIDVTATCVRVPVRTGHSESINIEFESTYDFENYFI